MKKFLGYGFFPGFVVLLLVVSCESEYSSETILECAASGTTNFTLQQLHELASETAIEIRDSLTISARVISNDQKGNMFNELYLQSSTTMGEFGVRIELELRDSYLRFPEGSEVTVQLKGLWIQKKYGILSLGKHFILFGTTSIGRIPFHEINSYLESGCEIIQVDPNILSIEDLNSLHLNTLIKLQGVEFIHESIGLNLAEEEIESIRQLTDCEKREVRLVTSGYADFFDHSIPDSHGIITGILLADSKGMYLRIRSWEDIQFDTPRCRIPIEPITSNRLFISEIADPDNAPEARFIEIYNSSDKSIPLENWQLIRYTNANTEPGVTTDLSGFSIPAEGTFTIAADSLGFTSLFGFSPDLEAGKNSAADSNGDDNVILMDPFGVIIDIFGQIGEDGSGTNHEFEDGRALRKPQIIYGNPEFSPLEWTVYNDTGAEGTIQETQQAPEDYTPGLRN